MKPTRSIKYNFALNLTNTIAGLLFPLITFPYISRILLPDGIGIINFCQAIIQYIVLLSAIGIPLYAVREIAKIRDNEKLRDRTTIEILLLHTFLSLLGYIAVLLLCLYVDKIQEYEKLFLLLSTSIFFNVIGVGWFYSAVEDFKYITIRSLSIKVLSIISLFIFVRTKSDIYAYAAILVASDVGNNVFNIIRLKKFICLKNITAKELNILRHIKPSLKIFMLNLIVSLYVNLPPIMLGFLSTEAAVGYFSSTTRITQAIFAIITALGTALLPRMSHYHSIGDHKNFIATEKKGMDFVFTICLPITIGLIIVSPQLIPIFSGSSFLPAVATLRLSAPNILIIGISWILGMQILYPQGKENIVIFCTFAGAITFLITSFILIPRFQQNGAAIANVIAEFIVTASMIILSRKYRHYSFTNKYICHILAFSLIMGIFVFVSQCFLTKYPLAITLIVEIIVGIVIYSVCLSLSGNYFLQNIKSAVTSKFRP